MQSECPDAGAVTVQNLHNTIVDGQGADSLMVKGMKS